MDIVLGPQRGASMSRHAARIARDHCLAPERVDAPISGGRYRSLFEDLPPLSVDEKALHELGRPGGPCDLGVAVTGRVDSRVAAVWPFFGQFIAHDITADRSRLVGRAERSQLRNARAPRANLEGLYGAGPVGMPYLYRKDDPAKLLLSPGGSDVPRNPVAIARTRPRLLSIIVSLADRSPCLILLARRISSAWVRRRALMRSSGDGDARATCSRPAPRARGDGFVDRPPSLRDRLQRGSGADGRIRALGAQTNELRECW